MYNEENLEPRSLGICFESFGMNEIVKFIMIRWLLRKSCGIGVNTMLLFVLGILGLLSKVPNSIISFRVESFLVFYYLGVSCGSFLDCP